MFSILKYGQLPYILNTKKILSLLAVAHRLTGNFLTSYIIKLSEVNTFAPILLAEALRQNHFINLAFYRKTIIFCAFYFEIRSVTLYLNTKNFIIAYGGLPF